MTKTTHTMAGNARRLGVEQLEDRLLLAGNVALGLTASGPSLDVSLTGDAASNSVAISTTGSGPTAELTIAALAGTQLTPGAINIPLPILDGLIVNTDFNGVSASFVTFNSSVVDALNDLQVSLEAGNDDVTVSNLSLDDNLSIVTGGGNDNVLLSNVYVDDSITIATGGGNDTVNIRDTTSDDGDWSISTGLGDDSVNIANSSSDDGISILTGAGNDSITMDSLQISDSLDIETGGGNDAVTLDASVVLPFINLGAGNDQLVATGNTLTDARFDGLEGNDVMLFESNYFVGVGDEDLNVFLGPGNDQLAMSGNTYGGVIDVLGVYMGDGDDYFVTGGNIFEPLVAIDSNVYADGEAGYDIVVALDSQPADQADLPPTLLNWELIDDTIIGSPPPFILPA